MEKNQKKRGGKKKRQTLKFLNVCKGEEQILHRSPTPKSSVMALKPATRQARAGMDAAAAAPREGRESLEPILICNVLKWGDSPSLLIN